MRGVTLLVTGILVGSAMQSAVGQQDRFVGLNHVGIIVDNLQVRPDSLLKKAMDSWC